jgi:hypothetical protein
MTRLTPASGKKKLSTQIGRLDAFDEALAVIGADVVDVTEQLRRLREDAGRLERLLSERDAALAAKERELSLLADAVATARGDADRSSGALREVTARADEREALVAILERELDTLRADVVARDDRLAEVRAELELSRRDSLAPPSRKRDETNGHVRFLGLPSGYRLAVSEEPCATLGELVEIDGIAFRVSRIGPSPLPADDRPCAFLTLN